MLSGVRILDLADESGGLVGRILADLGADVVKVEPPGGDLAGRRAPYLRKGAGQKVEGPAAADPERSLPWLVLQAGKRGITFDGAVPAARWAREQLFSWADVLIETFPAPIRRAWGLEAAATPAEHPRLVHCSITPFGCTGPYAEFRASDRVVAAMGGGTVRREVLDRPRLRCTLPASALHAGPEAALGILMALHAQAVTGRGRRVDVSLQECLTNANAAAAGTGEERGSDSPRARGFLATLALPALGARPELPGSFARSSAYAIGVRRPAPRIGEHQQAVFAEAGVGRAECEKLAAEGAV